MRWSIAAAALALAGCAYSYGTGGMGYVEHRSSPFMLWSEPSSRAPKMAEDRKISDQDCSQPVAQPGANLNCR